MVFAQDAKTMKMNRSKNLFGMSADFMARSLLCDGEEYAIMECDKYLNEKGDTLHFLRRDKINRVKRIINGQVK